MKAVLLACLISAALLVPSMSSAQTRNSDVLHLKNGSIIRGSVLSLVPNESVRMQTSDGSIFVFRMDEVDKLESSTETSLRPADFTRNNPWTTHRQMGGIGFGGAMAATMVGSLATGDEYFATTVIPVVGPWITMIRIESDPAGYYVPGGKSLLAASGVIQAGLLTYFVASLLKEKSYDADSRLMFSASSNSVHLIARF